MKEMKRILALVLCFVMLVGMMPAIALNADAATGEVIDAAIFCSDVHGNPSTVTSVFNGIKSADSTFNPSTASFVGDTQTTASSVTSAAQSVFSGVKCYYAFGNHDDEGDYGISDVTGLVYGDSSTNYYIYAISENSMASSNPDTSGFTSTVDGLDKTKPLFIISHLPLHSRRGDSNGAAVWYPAISAAANEMDIFFFWAHNHTGDNAVDQAAYYVAKNGTETITLEDTSTVVTPNFTYANAGYIDPPNTPARNNVATAVRIYDDSVNLTVYNAYGELSGTYAVNETVTRQFASTDSGEGGGSTDESTPATTDPTEGEEEGGTTTTTTYNYTATAATDGTGYILVSDGYALQNNGGTISAVAVTVSDDGSTITFADTVDVSTILWTIDSDGDVMNNGYYLLRSSGSGTKDMTISTTDSGDAYSNWTYTGTTLTTTGGSGGSTTFYAYCSDGTFHTQSSNSQELKFYVPTETEVEVTLSSIAVTTAPTKNVYNVGDTFSADGLVVTATYSDGSTAVVTPTSVSAPDMTTAGTKTVTVTYTEGDVTRTATFDITVNEVISDTATVTGIAVTGAKTEFNLGEALDTTGLVVTATYNDNGTTKTKVLDVAEYTVSEVDMTTEGEKTVTVSYTFNGTTVTDAYTITVTEKPSNDVTVGGSVTTTKTKTVYVLTSGNPSGNVLIADSNTAGDVHLVANDGGDLSNVTTTVIYGDCDGDGDSEYYIELTDTEATNSLWTVSGSYTFENQDEYLRCSNGNLSVSGTSTTWSYSNNRLSYRSSGGGGGHGSSGSTTYYLCYDSGWDVTSSSADSIYFYVPTTVEYEEVVDTTVNYTMRAEDLKQVVTTDNAATLTAKLSYCLQGNGTDLTTLPSGGSYSFTELADANGIITSISDDGTVTFSGAIGTATVKVAYTWSQDGETHTVYKNVTITATAPYYKVELHKKNDDGTLELIEAPIALKGVETNDTYSVWAVVKYYDGIIEDGEDGKDLGDVEDDRLYWVVSDPSIATIDPATGVITFTGNSYGTFDVTVYYRDADGNILCEDTITISATESQYVVPGDGTNDFPEYPEQGAIRFDKTAVAQGNFSQSGIAKVELSMTGVPYGTNVKTDVVIMVDMTASMSDDDVTAAEEAVKELIESLVYDEENDKYDSNIQLFIDVFYSASSDSDFSTKEYMAGTTISSAAELTAAKALIDFTQSSQGGGTRYNLAMKDVYETLTRDGHADNQFVVFVSDGVPTAYAPLSNGTLGTTITGSNSEDESLADGWFDLTTGAVTDEFETEYYSYLIKTAGIPIYTVGCNLTALTEPALVLDHMSSNYSPDGKTATGETKYSFFCTTSGGITDQVLEIFHGIGADIKEAATNVVVEDKIDSHYTMNFSLPENVTAAEAGMDDFYIQVLGYELDENNDRKADPTVLEKFLFNSDGTITHTIGATTCESCTHVTKTGDKITGIDGTYFDYTVDANGDEFLTWTAEKLDRTELALEYFVYLDHSAGEEAADQVDPGTYPTNEYATITYTNFNGKECQQKFPVPTMTWMGAKVTYVFYLVNEDGQPVNRAGKIIPFAEAIFVTDPVTYDVTWNEAAGIERLSADYLADGLVPDVYELYDEEAYYEIRVYQTEGVDEETKVVNYNYFVISGADNKLIDSAMDTDTTADNSTTKVYNTKAGVKYDEYGVYSQQNAGTVLNTTYVDENGNETAGTVTTTVKTDSIDYANTTVAFAVVWKPELVPDTVVVDYGLDVVIDVTTNDSLASGVTGVSTTAPANVEVNTGTYKTRAMGTSTNILIDDLIIGTAKVENLNAVRFSLNKSSGMQFNEPVEFFYESECNYYTYDTAGNRTLNTDFMYSSVTVIPATTIYYEDEYVTLKTYKLDSGDTDGDTAEYIETAGWDSSSVKASATQDQDRPGASKISADLDADNNYGFDAAYSAMSTYSMNNSAMTSVTAGKYATAEFTFYGTGFDIISLTDTTTGTIFVKVEDADGNSVKNVMVDTYYGYKMIKNEDGTISWETTTSNDPNALYQVPVIKVENLGYGKYTVTITASYVASFDNVADSTSYDFYLDAIRIYDPTGNENEVANDAYVKDGEGWPTYEEVRNKIIDAKTFDSIDTEAVNGIVFIDSNAANASVADYTSYGPNNELYLAPGQAIAFELNATAAEGEVAKVQMALKTVSGTASVKVYATDGTNGLDTDIATATDMYYDISNLNGKTVVIVNDGSSGVLSITNVKVTYTAAQPEASEPAPAMFLLRRASVDDALATLNVEEEVPETTVPEETEPETTEPETTVPEETEPETSVPEETEPETTTPEETEPEETKPSHQEQAEQVIRKVVKIIKGFLDWIFG